jgi:hypothetical protein
MEFTFSLNLHSPAWLFLMLLTAFPKLVSAAAHSRHPSHRPDQSKFASPRGKGELHQLSASKNLNRINGS